MEVDLNLVGAITVAGGRGGGRIGVIEEVETEKDVGGGRVVEAGDGGANGSPARLLGLGGFHYG